MSSLAKWDDNQKPRQRLQKGWHELVRRKYSANFPAQVLEEQWIWAVFRCVSCHNLFEAGRLVPTWVFLGAKYLGAKSACRGASDPPFSTSHLNNHRAVEYLWVSRWGGFTWEHGNDSRNILDPGSSRKEQLAAVTQGSDCTLGCCLSWNTVRVTLGEEGVPPQCLSQCIKLSYVPVSWLDGTALQRGTHRVAE